jgi:hypothetical protein
MKAALPPASRRGLVLIDPSYEIKSDYPRVVAAIKDGLQRFATGTYMVWMPFLPSIEARALPEKLKKLPADWLYASLSVRGPATKGHGMHGSAMFVVNPPWTLKAALEAIAAVAGAGAGTGRQGRRGWLRVRLRLRRNHGRIGAKGYETGDFAPEPGFKAYGLCGNHTALAVVGPGYHRSGSQPTPVVHAIGNQ